MLLSRPRCVSTSRCRLKALLGRLPRIGIPRRNDKNWWAAAARSNVSVDVPMQPPKPLDGIRMCVHFIHRVYDLVRIC